MSTDLLNLLKPIEGFTYKSQQLFKYCNTSQQYYISRSSSSMIKDPYWTVSLCYENIKPIYNSGSLLAFAQYNHISFDIAKIIRKQISTIQTSTKKEAHQKVIKIFNMYSHLFGETIEHQLTRKETHYNPFYLFYEKEPFVGTDCFTILKLKKNAFFKQDTYRFKNNKIQKSIPSLNVNFSQEFNSKPEIIRFLHQTVALHLPSLYYLQKNGLQFKDTGLWWKFFLQDHIKLEKIL